MEALGLVEDASGTATSGASTAGTRLVNVQRSIVSDLMEEISRVDEAVASSQVTSAAGAGPGAASRCRPKSKGAGGLKLGGSHAPSAGELARFSAFEVVMLQELCDMGSLKDAQKTAGGKLFVNKDGNLDYFKILQVGIAIMGEWAGGWVLGQG